MVDAQQLTKVVIAVAIGAVLLSPVVSTVNGSTGIQTVTNESVTAEFGSYQELEGYDIVNDSETVYVYNDTSGSYEIGTEGTDYELNETAGTIKTLNSSLVEEGEEVKVTYDYAATDSTTTTIAGLFPLFVALLLLVTLAQKLQGTM